MLPVPVSIYHSHPAAQRCFQIAALTLMDSTVFSQAKKGKKETDKPLYF